MRRDIGGIPFLGQILLGELLAGAGTSGSSAGACAAARFSAWTAAQISSRYTGMDFGAAMPMRTLEPLTSVTSTTTSSPTMIFSPGRRVMMSTGGFLLGVRVCWFERTERGLRGLRRRLLLEAGEEGSTNRGVRGLVDDLVALVAHD